MTVASAQKTLADLRAKLSETETRRVLLAAERSEISFAALVEGDPKAVKRLAAINAELIALEADACSVEAAIAEAERRVAEAQRAERAEAERVKAEQALKLREQMVDAAKTADAGLKQAFAALSEIYEAAAALNRLGSGPNAQVVEANLKRTLIAASLTSRFPLGALAPVDRHTAAELTTRWAEGIESFAAQRLGEPVVEPARKDAA